MIKRQYMRVSYVCYVNVVANVRAIARWIIAPINNEFFKFTNGGTSDQWNKVIRFADGPLTYCTAYMRANRIKIT